MYANVITHKHVYTDVQVDRHYDTTNIQTHANTNAYAEIKCKQSLHALMSEYGI